MSSGNEASVGMKIGSVWNDGEWQDWTTAIDKEFGVAMDEQRIKDSSWWPVIWMMIYCGILRRWF